MELAVETGPEMGRRIEISLGQDVIIGRHESCALRLEDPKVSREHARVSRNREGVGVVDLTSANGTYVNGERVTSAGLLNGDRLRVGTTEIVIHESEYEPALNTLHAQSTGVGVEEGSLPTSPSTPIALTANGAPIVSERSQTAQVALISGIFGVVGAFTWPFFGLLFFPGLIFSIVAVVLGIVALVKTRRSGRLGGRRAALGLILGIAGSFVTGLFLLLVLLVAAGSGTSFG